MRKRGTPYPNLNLLASRYSSINSMPIQRRPSRSATMPAELACKGVENDIFVIGEQLDEESR